MAQGEKRWTGSGDSVKRTFKPVPPQDWEAKLIADAAEIAQTKPETGAFPYIKGIRLQCFQSAEAEGGKDRLVFHSLFLSLKEDKSGNVGPNYAHQLRGLMKALGDVRDLPVKSKEVDGEEVEYLDPKAVIAYLKEHNGDTLSFHSKIQNQKGYDPQAIVDYFIEAEGSSAFGGEEEAPEEEDEDEAADEAEEVDEEPEEEEEPEPPPAPKPAKKAAAKGKKK